jgi:hypothetical protein
MFILTVPWDLRALWATASASARLYLLCLFVMGGYTVFRLMKVSLLYLRILRKQGPGKAPPLIRQTVTARLRNLRQLHFLFLLIFGACFASEFFGIIRAVQNSALSLSAATIQIFEPAAAFAFLVFVTLAFLHALQWFASGRLEKAAQSLPSDTTQTL